MFDKKQNTSWKQKPDEVAVEKDFYLVKDEKGDINLNYEDALEKMESCFPIIRQKLINHEILDEYQKEELAFFICLQLTRTPYFRKLYLEINNQIYRKSMKKIFYDRKKTKVIFERFLGTEISFSECDSFIQKVQNESISLDFSQHEIVHYTLIMAIELYPILMQMRWEILHAINGAYFITSDNPVVQDQPIAPYNKKARAFANQGSAKIFPISKELCFVAYGKEDIQIHSNVKWNVVTDANTRIVANSDRFIYGCNQQYIQELISEIQKNGFDLKFHPITF